MLESVTLLCLIHIKYMHYFKHFWAFNVIISTARKISILINFLSSPLFSDLLREPQQIGHWLVWDQGSRQTRQQKFGNWKGRWRLPTINMIKAKAQSIKKCLVFIPDLLKTVRIWLCCRYSRISRTEEIVNVTRKSNLKQD